MRFLPFIDLFLHPKIFRYVGVLIIVFILGFLWKFLLYAGIAGAVLLVILLIWDVWQLYRQGEVSARRSMARILSLGDANRVVLAIENNTSRAFRFNVIEELPAQLQIRDFIRSGVTTPQRGDEFVLKYDITPKERGIHSFGNTLVFVQSRLGFAERRHTIDTAVDMRVYPSLIQMKQFQLASIDKLQHYRGIVKSRRIGHGYEFEQINAYVEGDDYRSVNWKATSRHNELMVNKYTDEQSQAVYCLIDKSRQMLLPFNGMTLLDYAINTTLVISNVAIQKHDKSGLVTFSDTMHTLLRANDDPRQMGRIHEALYNERESESEGNYPLLYKVMNGLAKTRSLLFLFTNIESMHNLRRILPQLMRLRKKHLLVVVFFQNTELETYAGETAANTEDIYMRITAGKLLEDKKLLIHTLNGHGINTLLTRPDELTINSLNKYLELKARGLI